MRVLPLVLLLAAFPAAADTLGSTAKQAVKLCDPSSTKCSAVTDGVGGPAIAIDIVRSGIGLGGGAGGTSSLYGVAFPLSGTAAGFTDGTNMRAGFVFDLDTGAGTQHVVGLNLRFSANGGSVEAGTAANPLRVDPTGGTAQPVTGTFWQATQPVSGTFFQATQPISAVALPLPSGAAQDSTLTGGGAKSIPRGAAKGATTAADVTSTAQGADHQGLDSTIYGSGGNALAIDSSGRAAVQNPPNMDVASSTRAAASQLPAALDPNGYLATHEQGITVVRALAALPLNPFLQRCNAVRRSNCQP